MAALFMESSALIKRYVREVGSEWVIEQTLPRSDRTLFIASITQVEVCSALTRSGKQGGALSSEDSKNAIRYFRSDLSNYYEIIEVDPEIIDRATDLAILYALRGYDAVQLATALAVQIERYAVGLPPILFVSADGELNRAASAEGLGIRNPNDYPNS